MRVVYKYTLEKDVEPQAIELPAGAEIVEVAVQSGHPRVWALVDPEAPKVRRWFRIVSTGAPFEAPDLVYVGTMHDPHPTFPLVWHVFEDHGQGSTSAVPRE